MFLIGTGEDMIGKRLFVLLECLFVTMIGFGITLPVLPFYVERLALAAGAPRQAAALHVGMLTGVYPLVQLFFAPLWGRWSDRIGRKPLMLIGITGYVIAQILFGLATSLTLLYAARILGGILSSATLPVAAAYVADMTSEQERGRGMAWLGTAASLGVVVGPALGGLLARRDLHFNVRYGHLMADSFSIPFFTAATLGIITLVIAMRWLKESLPSLPHQEAGVQASFEWRTLGGALRPLLGLAIVAQFALAVFEATFALYAQAMFNYGPAEVGTAFVVCGMVMAVFQAGGVGLLAGRVEEIYLLGTGFGLMGASIALLSAVRAAPAVLTLVGFFALGMALISPNLTALISKRGGAQAGAALGVQNAANSIGQAGGPLLGSALFVWEMDAAYILTGALLIGVSLTIAWRVKSGSRS
jgi:DHA1 family multidrug resistance protein-like MFS transporter